MRVQTLIQRNNDGVDEYITGGRRHRNPMGMVKLRPLTESKPLDRL